MLLTPNRTVWLGTVVVGLALAGPLAAVEQGDLAPPWQARDFAGHAVDFPAVTQGKPAVVVFWATWCPYCKAFMPYLKNIEADYAKQGVKVVVDQREGRRPRRSAGIRAGLRLLADRRREW